MVLPVVYFIAFFCVDLQRLQCMEAVDLTNCKRNKYEKYPGVVKDKKVLG